MKLSAVNFTSWLKNNHENTRLFLIYGQDEGQVTLCYNDIINTKASTVDKIIHDYAEIAKDASLLVNDILSQSLFSDDKVIIINNVANTVNKKVMEIIKQDIPNHVTVIMIAGQLKPASNIRKHAETLKNGAAVACYADDQQTLQKYISTFFREKNVSISSEKSMLLSEILPPNRLMVKNELEKLLLYANNDVESISLEQLTYVIGDSAEINFDELCHAVALGNKQMLPKIFAKINAEKTSFILVIRVLSKYLTRILEIFQHMEDTKTVESAIEKLTPPVFFKQKNQLITVAKKVPKNVIKNKLKKILEVEVEAKRSNVNPLILTLNQLLHI